MLKDGTYTAWYKTPLDQGTGIVHVADGQIWGCDSLVTYHGSCKVDGDRFTTTVSTKRHTDGRATVFGIDDELTLDIEGHCPRKVATYTATAAEVPGMILQGTLILTEQQPLAPGTKGAGGAVQSRQASEAAGALAVIAGASATHGRHSGMSKFARQRE